MPARAVIVVVAALVASGHAKGEVKPQPQATKTAGLDVQVVTCAAGTLRVAFDPAQRVVVTRGGKRVAFATFDGRSAEGACGAAVHRKTLLRTNDGLLERPIYGRVELRCTATKPVHVAVHAILDGNHPGRTVGSSLILSAGRTTILGAVLKNKGDPSASRVYRAAVFCRR